MAGGIVTQVFAFRAISWALEIVMGTQVILIRGFENKLSIFYIIGGICNLIFDSILFAFGVSSPQYYIMTTLLSEYILLFIEYSFIKKNNLVDLKIVIHSFRKYTFITVGFLPTDMNMGIPFILNIAVTIIVCCVYYGIALIVTKDEVFMEMFNKVKGRLHG